MFRKRPGIIVLNMFFIQICVYGLILDIKHVYYTNMRVWFDPGHSGFTLFDVISNS